MNPSRQTDKWICCAGVVLMSGICVAGYLLGNHDVAMFGAGGFTAFSGPLFMAMNRDMTATGNGNGKASGSTDPTQAH